MSHPLQLLAVEHDGVLNVDVPAGVADVNEMFDELPLGIYEGLRTFDGVRFFGLQEHIDRAERSMERRGLESELDRDALRRAIDGAVRAYPGDSRVRFDVLAGPATRLGTESRVLVALSPFVPLPEHVFRDGVAVQLTSELRRSDPMTKGADWVIERRRLQGREGDYEPIMVDEEGRLLEGVMSNLVLVRDGAIRTAGDQVLQGITRGTILALAREIGLDAVEEAVHRDELAELDEAFFTTSVRSVVPIASIAGVALRAGGVGPVTRRLLAAYAEKVEREARPAWPVE